MPAVRPLGLLSLALVALGACGHDTAILIEITEDSATPVTVDQLQIVLASQAANQLYVLDPGSKTSVRVSGRDLVHDPYRLYVNNGLSGNGPIAVAVVGFTDRDTQNPAAFGYLSPQRFVSDDILVVQVVLLPVAQTSVATRDTGCLYWIDQTQSQFVIGAPNDQDCDGYTTPADCDDSNPNIHPGAPEICANGKDDNCNGVVDEEVDADGDHITNCAGDCNDNDPAIHPGAQEICDGKDNDCSGVCDNGFDADGDGYTTCKTLILGNAGAGNEGKCMATAVADCNDTLADIHPGAAEACDGKDNDCSGKCDDLASLDPDGDGFTSCGTLASDTYGPVPGVCGAKVASAMDCDQSSTTGPAIHPFAHESCDGKDDNCDSLLETKEFCFRHADGAIDAGAGTPDAAVQECLIGRRTCTENTTGTFALGATCDPAMDAALDTIPVDPAVCATYDGACKTNVAPFECTLAMTASVPVFDCRLQYTHTSGNALTNVPDTYTLCTAGRAATALPAFGTPTGCTWTMVGGTGQEQYVAGFNAAAGDPVPSLAACAGNLVITPSLTNRLIPQPDRFVILYNDAVTNPAKVVLVHVTPMKVASCADPVLTCLQTR